MSLFSELPETDILMTILRASGTSAYVFGATCREYNTLIREKETELLTLGYECNATWATYKLGGRIHRIYGPAETHVSGLITWYAYGKIHRVNGPAVIRPDGDVMWYLNGERVIPQPN